MVYMLYEYFSQIPVLGRNGSELANVSSTYSVYNQSFSCQGDEKSLSDCPTSTLDVCPDNSSIFIKCQGNVIFNHIICDV